MVREYNRGEVARAMRYDFLGFALDTDTRQLTRGAEDLHLSAKAFELLCLLVAERPRAVNKREIYDRLWPDTFVGDASLPVLVREIRSALGEARSAIRTVHRFGYAFAADVTTPDADEPRETGPVHVLVHGEREIRLGQGDNVIGRDAAADVVVLSTSVSRRHAIVTVDGDTATLTDLGSKNGTKVDGTAVTGSVELREGSTIELGVVQMIYARMLPGLSTDSLVR